MKRKLFIFVFLGLCFLVFGRGYVVGITPTPTIGIDRTKECEYGPAEQKDACLNCIKSNNAWTVFGCLPVDASGFTRFALRFAIGIGGGLAFLTMLAGAFMVITSAGDPGRLATGKKMITSAVLGLLLIIFSLFILRLTGREILGLPGL